MAWILSLLHHAPQTSSAEDFRHALYETTEDRVIADVKCRIAKLKADLDRLDAAPPEFDGAER